MSNEFIQVSEDLTYSKPEQEMSGRGEYFSYLPSGSSTVPAGQRVIFNIRSSTAFCDYGRSYANVTFVPTGAITDTLGARPILSCGGIQTVFTNITERVSGANFDSFDNYNQLAVIRNALQSATRQTTLLQTEGFTGFSTPTVAPSGSVPIAVTNAGVEIPAAGTKFCIPIPSNLSTVNKLIPLCLMNSWDLSYALQPVSGKSVFQNPKGATGYTIQMEIVLFLVEPSQMYMEALYDNLREGKTLDLAMTFIKSYPSSVGTSTSSNVQNIVGQLKSCSSLLQVITGTVSAATANTDAFSPVSAVTNLISSQWLLDSKTYPLNKEITTGAEAIILGLSAFNTRFGEMLPQGKVNFISFSTGNGAVKTGVKLMSGNVQSNLKYSSNATSTDIINTYISAEGTLRIGYQGSIVMDYR